MLARSKQAGFTLIELLVALFIFAIIAVITAAILHTVINTSNDLKQKSTQLSALQFTNTVLLHDISYIVNQSLLDKNQNIQPPVMGLLHELQFNFQALPNAFIMPNTPAIQHADISLQQQTLVETIYFSNDQTLTRVLLRQVKQLTFGYLDNTNGFRQNWFDTKNLPFAINITVYFTNDSSLQWLIPILANQQLIINHANPS